MLNKGDMSVMKTMQIKIRGITDAAMFVEYANE